ncbi:hypothetical protein [Desulfolutivibrio sp.]|uniref:hypothetical protein n=1 Tax=Desulfolutivibrio sp. TaxID=2773296 RepID=UPI002F964790
MKTIIASLALAFLVAAAAPQALAQSKYYCVKPDGAPVCAILVTPGARHDPSVLCNLSCAPCNLTCSAILRLGDGARGMEDQIPVVQVRPEALTGRDMQSNIETPEYCNAQYQNCLANCRRDPQSSASATALGQCEAYCQSVRSGCGTGNSGQ